MNFQQLKYFRTVYECRNITKAAERLHISQPAISTAVKELETELGAPLFIRQNRGLVATEEGVVFYSLACRMLAQCENARQVIREVAERKSQVRIGMVPMAGSFLFPKIYKKLSASYPEITMEILEDGSYELVKRLEEDQVEMIIVPEGVECPGMAKREIYRTRMVFAISRDHPLAQLDQIGISQLAQVPLAMYRKGFIQSQNIGRLFEQQGVPMKVMAQTSNFMTIKTLVDCGAAGGFLMKEIYENSETVRTYEIPELEPFAIHLFWKQDGYLSAAARKFLRCCRDLQESI